MAHLRAELQAAEIPVQEAEPRGAAAAEQAEAAERAGAEIPAAVAVAAVRRFR